jgi:hypothetical protein
MTIFVILVIDDNHHPEASLIEKPESCMHSQIGWDESWEGPQKQGGILKMKMLLGTGPGDVYFQSPTRIKGAQK